MPQAKTKNSIDSLKKTLSNENVVRSAVIEQRSIDEEKRTVEIAISSEEPYRRWWGIEILDHSRESVDLSRLNDGGAVLVNHDHSDHVGTIEKAWLDGDRVLRAVVRFGRSDRAQEIFQDVLDGIRKHISVGYFIEKLVLEEEDEDTATYRITKWTPFEASFVAVPADPTVGVGKNFELASSQSKDTDPRIEQSQTQKGDDMPQETKTGEVVEPKIDVQAERDAERKAERARVDEILQIGKDYGCEDMAREAVSSGEDANEFIRKALEKVGNRKLEKADDPGLGMEEKDLKNFSVLRMMNALANPSDAEAQKAAGFEFELSRAAAKKQRRAADEKGMVIPVDVLRSPIIPAQRDMNVGTPADGGNLVATDLLSASFIDLLRVALISGQLGATMLTDLNGDIAIPRKTGGAAFYWLAENGEPTESSATFDQVALTPKTIGAYTEISRKLMKQSSIDAEALARFELLMTLAEGIDTSVLYGTGADNQPKGIANYAGIGSVPTATDGSAPTWAHIVDLESKVANANALRGMPKYLTNTKVRGKLKTTEKFANSGREIWTEDGRLNGTDAIVSNIVKGDITKGTGTNLSDIFFGNFADVLIGMWGGLDLLIDPYTKSKSGGVVVNALQSVDINLRHPESFALGSGFITA